MNKQTTLLCACVSTLLLVATSDASLLTAFDSLGPNNLWQEGPFAWTVCGSGAISRQDYSQGDAFTPAVAGQLQRIEVGMGSDSGNSFSLALYEDTPNGGPLLWSQGVSNPSMPPLGTVGSPTVVDVSNGPVLETTKQYWLIASASGSTNLGWGFNVIGINGPHATRSSTSVPYTLYTPDGAVGSATGAFRILVPEPGSLAFVALGGLGLLGRRWPLR